MTLGFMQTWPKEMDQVDDKTYFIEKIHLGLLQNELSKRIDYVEYHEEYRAKFGCNWDSKPDVRPKLHTIRQDSSKRWKEGKNIHFAVKNQTKDRFQFAPVVKCVSVQNIEIYDSTHLPRNNGIVLEFPHGVEVFYLAYDVKIDGRFLDEYEIRELAKNDGFESVENFFKYFDKDFKGKLIHWTDQKY